MSGNIKRVKSFSKPKQSRWFEIGKHAKHGYLCFAILKPPNFSVTVELILSDEKYELAISLISFAVVYQWDRRMPKCARCLDYV